MATTTKAPGKAAAPKPPSAAQAKIAQYLPLEKTFRDALNLAGRFRNADGFRDYLRRRMPMVVPALALFVIASVACAAATVIFLADRHAMLALPGLVLAPFVLVGSLFVQLYVFFSWLEGRALARALGHRVSRTQGMLAALINRKLKIDLGEAPRVPWGLAALFLFLPVAILVKVSVQFAAVLMLLGIAMPLLFARFDK